MSSRVLTLLDFDDPREVGLFRPIDDVVMGGVSASRFELTAPGIARFAGMVSLANNGGFASVRSAARDWAAGGAEAFVVRAKGDGQQYKLTLRVDDGFDGLQYQARFTAGTEWSEIRLPVAQFQPSFRGRRVAGAPPLDPGKIRMLGFMISDRQDGEFSLEIDWIAVELQP